MNNQWPGDYKDLVKKFIIIIKINQDEKKYETISKKILI